MIPDWTMSEWITVGVLALLGLVTLVFLAYLAVGLFRSRALFRRELSAYFTTPVGYMVFFFFLAGTGGLFAMTLNQLTTTGPKGVEYPMQSMYGELIFWGIFPLIPAMLTMRLFAEERATGTLEMLMTAPVRDWQVVLSKYFACLKFYAFLWIPTLLYLPVLMDLEASWNFQDGVWSQMSTILMLSGLGILFIGLLMFIPQLGNIGRLLSIILLIGGLWICGLGTYAHYTHADEIHLINFTAGIDPAPVWTTYLGMFLVGAMFLALGMFVSTLVRDQLVSALITVAVSLVFVVGTVLTPLMESGSEMYRVVYYFTVPMHFRQTFTRGLLDTRHLVLYGSVAVFFVLLTVRSLERRRWAAV